MLLVLCLHIPQFICGDAQHKEEIKMIKINELELQEVSCLHEGSTLLLSFEMEDMTL